MICLNIKCNKEHDGKFASGKYCSIQCSNSRNWTEEDKLKKSDTSIKLAEILCLGCNNSFKPRSRSTKFCSKPCQAIYSKSQITNIKDYRIRCQFRFGIKKYPNEFNFELINKFGFYSPSNKRNNLNGISRDHKYSVSDGYINNIDPKIIAHPANCELLIHSDNISKHKKSSITIEQLLIDIEKWNLKYS